MFFWFQNSPSSSACHFLVSLSPIFFSSWVPHFHFFSAIIFEDSASQETFTTCLLMIRLSIWEPVSQALLGPHPLTETFPHIKQHPITLSLSFVIVLVQSLSCVWLFATPWTTAHQASLSFTISYSLLKLTSIESVMPSSHLVICRPLLRLPSIFPSIKVISMSQLFASGSIGASAPKYWSLSFIISPSNEYSGWFL